jgi:hypothetical protein
MQVGKFKVFKHLNDWWEEFRLYHRRDGRVVKEGDDLMAATRYAIMMLRYASTKATYDRFRRPILKGLATADVTAPVLTKNRPVIGD